MNLPSDRELLDLAQNARTVKDVDRLEAGLRARGATDLRWLDDNRNAWSSLSNEAPSWIVMLERLVNGMDAVIELEMLMKGIAEKSVTSPIDAARKAVGYPPSGAGLKPAERRKFAERIELSIYDGRSVLQPTVTVRDYGIGIRAADVPKTLLKLEGEDKLEKAHAHGRYGKGGNNTAVFSERIVFVTRRDPRTLRPGELDEIAVTVLRRREPEGRVKAPFVFDYLVTPARIPLAIPAAGMPFAAGTYIGHIEYEVDKRIARDEWKNDQSVQAVSETFLWRSTLPFLVRDHRRLMKRDDRVKSGEVFTGKGPKLDEVVANGGRSESAKSAEPALIRWRTNTDPIVIPDLGGSVRVSWYVFPDEDRRRYYVSKGYAALFTSNGQVHDTWDRHHFQSLVKGRSVVAEHITVVIDCDGLPTRIQGRIFSSSRASKRKVKESQRLEERVVEWLSEDPELKEIEEELQRERFAKTAKAMSAEFLHRFNRLLAQRKGVVVPDPDETGPVTPPRQKVELLPEPTYMHGPSASLYLVPGKITRFPLEINAVNGFVPDRGRVVLAGVPEKAGIRYQPVHPLKNGRLGGWFDVSAEAPLETYSYAALELTFTSPRTGRPRTLRFPVILRVATARQKAAVEKKERPKPKKKGQGQKPGPQQPSVAVIWDDLDPAAAAELRDLSGDVLADNHGYAQFRGFAVVPTVILNNVFPEWSRFRERYLSAKSQRMVDFHKEQYATQLGLYVHDLVKSEEKIASVEVANATAAAEMNGAKAMTPEQRQRAIALTARTVVVALQPYSKLLDTIGNDEKVFAAATEAGSA